MSVEARWVQANYVVPGKSLESLLYKYLQGSGFSPAPLGTMPLGSGLSSYELVVLKAWIDQMGTPSEVPVATPTPALTGTVLIGSQDYPRLGDRRYMKSVFDEVFGPAAASTTNTLVLPSASLFGGSCDSMKQAPASTQAGGDTCGDLDVSSYAAPFVPVSSTPRAGLTMKVCNILAFNDTTLQYAIKNATQKTDLAYLSTNSIPSSAEIVAAYNLFFTGKDTPPQAVITSLTTLAQAVQSPNFPSCPAQRPNCQFDPWRYVFLVLCYQPDWQVL